MRITCADLIKIAIHAKLENLSGKIAINRHFLGIRFLCNPGHKIVKKEKKKRITNKLSFSKYEYKSSKTYTDDNNMLTEALILERDILSDKKPA